MPQRDVHRNLDEALDEAHESILKVGDLLAMMAEPVDSSSTVTSPREPQLDLGQPVIETQDLHLEYITSDGRAKLGMCGVTLTICHGETVGIAGPSGAGKT